MDRRCRLDQLKGVREWLPLASRCRGSPTERVRAGFADVKVIRVASRKTTALQTSKRHSARPTAFTRVRRLSKRGAYDAATIYSILDAATHCHVAHVIDGRPVAMPTLHWRRDNRLYWHGSAASRMLGANAAGGAVCVTATLIDGFVLARSGFNHSMNYRSAMCFGIPTEITDPVAEERGAARLSRALAPGQVGDLAAAHTQRTRGDPRPVHAHCGGLGQGPGRRPSRPGGGRAVADLGRCAPTRLAGRDTGCGAGLRRNARTAAPGRIECALPAPTQSVNRRGSLLEPRCARPVQAALRIRSQFENFRASARPTSPFHDARPS